MITQDNTVESNISPELGTPSQAEVDTAFDRLVGELEVPSPEADRVKDIVAFKGAQRHEPAENQYRMGD